MSELRFFRKKLFGYPLGEASRFPAFRDPIKSTIGARLDESDGLFINYGMFSDSLPYTMFDDYDLAERRELDFAAAVLENEHLRAEFVLDLGGRMWSLYDKDRKRELITDNKEFLPGNLAIRNAWFAGGVEFNCGRRGHDADTCAPRFAAELRDPRFGPVLRIYGYSIDRKCPYQMDFFLPADSRFLFARGRIGNPNAEVVPMYFWSNIAAELTPGCRVVVPADETYLNMYDGGSHFVTRIAMPDGEGFDQTHPENFTCVRDHFYDIPATSRKYEALLNRDGIGFIHLSTRRLQGRKLFVWGRSTGGAHWQKKLLAPGVGDYLELQAGLAKTQQECLPMPPETAWEWLEAYGGIEVSPEAVSGSWAVARELVGAWTEEALPESRMDDMLAATRDSIARKPGEVRSRGSGAAALEELRRRKKLAPHLDFGVPGEAEAEWVKLLSEPGFDDAPPRSFSVDPVWREALLNAREGWKKHYHLTLQYFREQDWERAREHADAALSLRRNAWTLHAMANVMLRTDDVSGGLKLLTEAALCPEADAYLIKETLKLLTIHGKFPETLALYSQLKPRDQHRPTALLHYAAALAGTGRNAEAEAVLLRDGGLELPDAREGDVKITALFQQVEAALGRPDASIPTAIDYRTK